MSNSKNYLSKTLKWLGTFLIIFVLLLAGIPYIFKDDILNTAKDAAHERINATLAFDNDKASLSLLWTFPNFSCKVSDLTLTGKEEFEGKKLMEAKDFEFNINALNAFFGTYIINDISLTNVEAYAQILPNGKANYDILKPRISKKRDISILHWALENVNVAYNNEQRSMQMDFKNLNHHGSGSRSMPMIDVSTQTTIEEIGLSIAGLSYSKKTNISLDFNANIDTDKKVCKILNNEFKISQLGLILNGELSQPSEEATEMDLKFSVSTAPLANLLPLVSIIAATYYNDAPRKGLFKLDGYVKGLYHPNGSIPDYGLSLGMQSERFKDFRIPLPLGEINREVFSKIWDRL